MDFFADIPFCSIKTKMSCDFNTAKQNKLFLSLQKLFSLSKYRKRKSKLLPKKIRYLRMKVTHKHTEAALTSFYNHRCLSQ